MNANAAANEPQILPLLGRGFSQTREPGDGSARASIDHPRSKLLRNVKKDGSRSPSATRRATGRKHAHFLDRSCYLKQPRFECSL